MQEVAFEPLEARTPRTESRGVSRFQQRLLAAELLLQRRGADPAQLDAQLEGSRVDLNPHQVDAALFGLQAARDRGAMLADEVGLGKTVEAGLVMAQRFAEGARRQLVLAPTSLLRQWQLELRDKFGLSATIARGALLKKARKEGCDNVFRYAGGIVLASYGFARLHARALEQVQWDLAILDEAHRLRGVCKPGNRAARDIREALSGVPKLLLTATPMQNELSELWGLMSFLHDDILGDQAAFEIRYCGEKGEERADELRARMAPYVFRTLRRQVQPYVKYTRRLGVVAEFHPTPKEQELYDRVSHALASEWSVAFDPGRRVLMTLIYRKLLASSPHAVGSALARLAQRLGGPAAAAEGYQKLRTDVGFEGATELANASEDDGAKNPAPRARNGAKAASEGRERSEDPASDPDADAQQLGQTVRELSACAEIAHSITRPSKGDALVRGLREAMELSRQRGLPTKAVIFTEFKRTLDYLVELLKSHGFNRIAVLHGAVQARQAAVEEFRDSAEILITTEVGSEGLNLQFCNILVNYDLPWNPQRLEQRIGRCHRYGQKHDVVVLNLLNADNAAEVRLFEVLRDKLALFDGMFGASDEVLGALESGINFERRVLEIMQTCRSNEDIQAAFDQLVSQLTRRISKDVVAARSRLIEEFDGEVADRLVQTEAATAQRLRWRRTAMANLCIDVLGARQHGEKLFLDATRAGAADVAPGDIVLDSLHAAHPWVVAAASKVVDAPYRGIDALAVDVTRSERDALRRLHDGHGWWFAYRLRVERDDPLEERLLHVVLVRDGERFRALAEEDAEALSRLPMHPVQRRAEDFLSVTDAVDSALGQARDLALAAVRERLQSAAAMRQGEVMQSADDRLAMLRAQVSRAKEAWRDARGRAAEAKDPQQRADAMKEAAEKLAGVRRALKAEASGSDTVLVEAERRVKELGESPSLLAHTTLVGAAFWWGV